MPERWRRRKGGSRFTDWSADRAFHFPAADCGVVHPALSPPRCATRRCRLASLGGEATAHPVHTGGGRIALANYGNLEKAAQAWRTRGDRSEQNQLVFIFCAHGYGFGDTTSLLLADFDFRRQNRWEPRALDLRTFTAGMEARAASHQLFLVDVRRRPHGDLLSPRAAIGRSPVQPMQTPRGRFATSRIVAGAGPGPA
jgi:hypothetical protein